MRNILCCLLLAYNLLAGCNKLTDVDEPPNRHENPFTNDVTATQVVLGIYEKCMNQQQLLNGHISRFSGLYGGEISQRSTGGEEADFQFRTLKANNRFLSQFWTPAYEGIARCNLAIQALPGATGVSKPVKDRLIAEARFLRALHYFYLVNLFERVPLVTGTDIGENSQLGQSSPQDVYFQIVADLQAAIPLLPARHPEAGNDSLVHTRVELGAAQALMARVQLYLGNYTAATQYAGLVIDGGAYTLSQLSETFINKSPETIFQLKPVMGNVNTAEGALFLLEQGNMPVYELTSENIRVFDPRDQRKINWTRLFRSGNVDKYQVQKYKIKTGQPRKEYCIVLRLAEQYLIRAEARARLNDVDGAIADLEQVRRRAGLTAPSSNIDVDSLLTAIALERQAELFGEWGHRALDLHRWWRLPDTDVLHRYADSALRTQADWAPFKLCWPLPQQELLKNARLKQNAGYQ